MDALLYQTGKVLAHVVFAIFAQHNGDSNMSKSWTENVLAVDCLVLHGVLMHFGSGCTAAYIRTNLLVMQEFSELCLAWNSMSHGLGIGHVPGVVAGEFLEEFGTSERTNCKAAVLALFPNYSVNAFLVVATASAGLDHQCCLVIDKPFSTAKFFGYCIQREVFLKLLGGCLRIGFGRDVAGCSISLGGRRVDF